ncbi:hypothetical protein GQX74_013805 [Glossina fuscipes]|nr:hypothetical protein GQX74_013805 [Glossina fuscipes]
MLLRLAQGKRQEKYPRKLVYEFLSRSNSFKANESILTWRRGYRDHEGGSPGLIEVTTARASLEKNCYIWGLSLTARQREGRDANMVFPAFKTNNIFYGRQRITIWFF